MSLLHLFSRPKVEKARGYVEAAAPGLLNFPFVQAATAPAVSTPEPPVGFGLLDPLPTLSQASRQATKQGRVAISVLAADGTLVKSRVRALAQHHTKLIVLLPSGYLLQYATDGSDDRLPESILALGPDSAAFACDLIPGQQFVLQVVHSIEREASIPGRTSFLTRLGIRHASTRRSLVRMLLILLDAFEMETWMSSIRQVIDSRRVQPIPPIETSSLSSSIPESPDQPQPPNPRASHSTNASSTTAVASRTNSETSLPLETQNPLYRKLASYDTTGRQNKSLKPSVPYAFELPPTPPQPRTFSSPHILSGHTTPRPPASRRPTLNLPLKINPSPSAGRSFSASYEMGPRPRMPPAEVIEGVMERPKSIHLAEGTVSFPAPPIRRLRPSRLGAESSIRGEASSGEDKKEGVGEEKGDAMKGDATEEVAKNAKLARPVTTAESKGSGDGTKGCAAKSNASGDVTKSVKPTRPITTADMKASGDVTKNDATGDATKSVKPATPVTTADLKIPSREGMSDATVEKSAEPTRPVSTADLKAPGVVPGNNTGNVTKSVIPYRPVTTADMKAPQDVTDNNTGGVSRSAKPARPVTTTDLKIPSGDRIKREEMKTLQTLHLSFSGGFGPPKPPPEVPLPDLPGGR
ncbi:hypothetical protein K470DRAFT_256710 [Piedraia hortae CBS 480.64]|uniref:PH domain-containing protein n=1 Tax=Piedraia hortae CBS 480.64 TaxID=1314780 RepID=A0A6A7C289_9PEZI|nr:hypothetical protein K470DRAFT_256710 [Piedraia hortae CBS 480.64]